MYTEIEAKLKVDSHEEAAKRLGELGGEFVGERLQRDYYFDDCEGSFKKSDRCIRLRHQRSKDGERVFLTYKGAKEKDEFKKRQEIEIEVGDGEALEAFLLALGFARSLDFEKRRRLWRFGNCKVALDELPLLGNFVEIEGPDGETIADVQERLGLSGLVHIMESYACLMEERLSQLGMEERSISL